MATATKDMKILVIPLGGRGQRFVDAGYREPKALIRALGRPILMWVLHHVDLKKFDAVIIPHHPDLTRHRFADTIRKEFPKISFNFYVLPDRLCGSGRATDAVGAAVTLKFSLEQYKAANPSIDISQASVLCMDGDNFYPKLDISQIFVKNPRNLVYCQNDRKGNAQGEQSPYSHVELNAQGKVIAMVEKKRVSAWACTGAYGFERVEQLINACNAVIEKTLQKQQQSTGDNVQFECYISHVVAHLLSEGKEVYLEPVDPENWVCLGTPMQLRLFTNNMPRRTVESKLALPPMRICFDLDNTLVTYPEVAGDYTTCKPIPDMIDFLQYLKRFGHTIIIYTARRMKTHGGNVGRLLKDIGMLTFEQLDKFGIPYDEIYFGKPEADVYIDDNAVSAFEDLRMKLGFYDDVIDCRSFHGLEFRGVETVAKSSTKPNGLKGEIHYYKNIPPQVKDMFPVLIHSSEDGSMLEMERVTGVPVSRLYLSRQLTTEHLTHILNSLQRLHSVPWHSQDGDNVYVNYAKKMQERRTQYASVYEALNSPQFNATYDQVVEALTAYEREDRAIKVGLIHGDPVFTNILFNQFGKIKFIDMRGWLGDKLSVQGDALYDYAKVYQSLCGYDEVLSDISTVDQASRSSLQSVFWEHFHKHVPGGERARSDLITITKSLILSLIPLHDTHRAQSFFRLLENVA